MKSKVLFIILSFICLICITNKAVAQSCATVYINDDNLPSLPDALCVDDELALCFDLAVDEASFNASLVEFNYNLLLGDNPSEVGLESDYISGTAIDENASGQICFKAAIPAGPSGCEPYELSLEIISVFYNDPACSTNEIAFDLNITSPVPIAQTGPNLNDLVPLLGIGGLNPITVMIDCGGLKGCTDETACNYNPDACVDDESCQTPGSACDDGDDNTTDDIVLDDCSCAGTPAATEVDGCTDETACNYDPAATNYADDSCLYNDCNEECGGSAIPGSACDDGDDNTEDDVYGEDCACSGTPIGGVPGCTDSSYCNYDPAATIDDGSCIDEDCAGICGGPYLPGSRCDDFSVLTINDVFNSNCDCVGEEIENFCELESFDVNFTCEDNDKVTVEIAFEGEGTFNATDGVAEFNNIQQGKYVYEGYPTNAGYEYVITQTEGNNVGCNTIVKFNTPRCLPCSYNPGSIGIDDYTQEEIDVCEGDILQLRNSGTVLDAYQSIFFIIHTAGPDISLSDFPLNEDDIFARSRDIENTEDLTGSYWATAVVATSDEPGKPDLQDPCFAVTNTVKINLLEAIEFTHTPTCDEDEGYTFELELEGGSPPYNVDSRYFNGAIEAGESYTSDVLPNGAMYILEMSDDNGCEVESELFIVTCASTVPIELISFSGEALSNSNLLKWVTASEINNDFFTIQKSKNGFDYEKVAIIKGSGTNSSSSTYQHFDRNISSGTTYYKLIQTDYDGTTVEVSNIDLTRSESTNFSLISILPVPAINNLEITLQTESEETVFNIYDLIGRPVARQVQTKDLGTNVYKLNVENLSSGVYFVSITNNNKAITKRFIKD